jgi:hypothetical protein
VQVIIPVFLMKVQISAKLAQSVFLFVAAALLHQCLQ